VSASGKEQHVPISTLINGVAALRMAESGARKRNKDTDNQKQNQI
jgi:hypothetical protein